MADVDPNFAPARPTDPIGRLLWHAAVVFALAGGVLLAAMTLMSVVSILGRWLFTRPLPGDVELAQLAVAMSVASFLPYCALRGGHVLADFFTNRVRPVVKSMLDAIGSLSIAVVAGLIGWRMVQGLIDMRDSGETTMVLGVPQWYAYAPMLLSFWLLAACALYLAVRHLLDLRSRAT